MSTLISTIRIGDLPYTSGQVSSREAQQDLTNAASSLKALLEKNEESRVAFSQLNQNSVESEKAYAKKRLEQLEDMLHHLIMLRLPPAVIAQIVKELKGIIEHYPAAGSAQNADASTSDAGVSAFDQRNEANPDEAHSAEGGNGERNGVPDVGDSPRDASTVTAAGAGSRSPASAYLAIARATSVNDEAVADADFMSRAKALLTQLKTLMKQASAQSLPSQGFEFPIHP